MSLDPHLGDPSADVATPRNALGMSPRPTAWREVRTPGGIGKVAGRMAWLLLALAIVFSFVPWQQTATGAGRVIAYVPSARQQEVAAPIKGRVVEWLVREGETITVGQPLVELSDNDPDFVDRIVSQRALVETQLAAALAKVAASEAKLEAAEGALEAALRSADAKVESATQELRSAEQDVRAAEAAAQTSEVQRDRSMALAGDGLQSTQTLENAVLKAEQASAKLASARAKQAKALSDIEAARQDREKARTEANAKLADARGDLQTSFSSEADYRQKLVDIDVKLARQATRVVLSPASGVVARVRVGQGTVQVKEGDALALIIPDTESRAVELWLDGNDVSLVRPGQEVRLQFEGWPALQFSGWPSVAVGTFGGVVDYIDTIDDGKGHFRVVILPHDVSATDWPDPRWLRQGLRAKGWVMLAQVPIGYELWRQLNDFPPAVDPPGTSASEAKDDKDVEPSSQGGKDIGDPVKKPKGLK